MTQPHIPHPDLPPPPTPSALSAGCAAHLFSSPANIALTALALYLLYALLPPVLNWAFFDATWRGDSREACSGQGGACWVFIRAHFAQFMYGFYPEAQRWRVDMLVLLLIFGMRPLFIRTVPAKLKRRLGLGLLIALSAFSPLLLMRGGILGLRRWKPAVGAGCC
jgi:general L-amino acid transport system permease protein